MIDGTAQKQAECFWHCHASGWESMSPSASSKCSVFFSSLEHTIFTGPVAIGRHVCTLCILLRCLVLWFMTSPLQSLRSRTGAKWTQNLEATSRGGLSDIFSTKALLLSVFLAARVLLVDTIPQHSTPCRSLPLCAACHPTSSY